MVESISVSREDHQMKHLIVVAHPAENSFTMALMRTYAAELEKLGHTQRTFDLYRSSFDPVLGARELAPVDADHPASADVAQAQDDIRAADVLTVLYPLWWLTMPAMMKGYIECMILPAKSHRARYSQASRSVSNRLTRPFSYTIFSRNA